MEWSIVVSKENIAKYRADLLEYTEKLVWPEWEIQSLHPKDKLLLCWVTPETVMKDWPVKVKDPKNPDKKIPLKYVPVWYIERCLNFVSNFQRWCDVLREWITSYSYAKDWETKTVYDAWCLVRFYIILWDQKIERSCYWSWKSYDNPASSRFNVYEASRSIATKAFADTLWIASDKLSWEFAHLRDDIIEASAEKTEWNWHKKKLKMFLKKMWVITKKQVKDFFQKNFLIDVDRENLDELQAQWYCE